MGPEQEKKEVNMHTDIRRFQLFDGVNDTMDRELSFKQLVGLVNLDYEQQADVDNLKVGEMLELHPQSPGAMEITRTL